MYLCVCVRMSLRVCGCIEKMFLFIITYKTRLSQKMYYYNLRFFFLIRFDADKSSHSSFNILCIHFFFLLYIPIYNNNSTKRKVKKIFFKQNEKENE